MIFDKMTYEEMRNQFRLKGLKNMRRFRQKIVSLFGDYYFKTVTEAEAMKQCKLVHESITSLQELNAYCNKLISTRMEFSHPQFEVHFIPDYNDKECAIILKTHHVFCDGMSLSFTFVGLGD
jgi:NRPS condensation-like uncharacterized protein